MITTLFDENLTANIKRDVDLSLYLVTGRDLLPPGMVPTVLFRFCSSLIRSTEPFDFSRGG